ncbi:sugar ABC transporter substrate-binding protein [Superficieibacter sp.]|uniref:ABC transporter substrate-binding protein n=1 Tax=Superficieibacter sp. TaxID=2303322 RepID=UPI0028B1E034|nr:sugar ABC transporter substrate-binding protein [Superficieibacter sp.]
MITRKLFVASLALGAVFSVQAKEITVWSWDPHFNIPIMKQAGEIYRKTHPDVTFNVVDMGKSDVEQKLQTMLASGVTEGLPDIVLLEDNKIQRYIQFYPGAFEPLDGKIDYNVFANQKIATMTYENKIYGIPFDSGVTALFYRKDIIEQAGFSDADMRNLTWDRYIEIGKQVTSKTGKKMLAADPSDNPLVTIMMQSAGSWYFDKDNRPTIANNPVLKAALQYYVKINNAGIVKPVFGWAEATNALNSDKNNVASVITGVWGISTIKAEPNQAGKWRVAEIPIMEGVKGATHASNLGGSSWYVLASSKQKDIAINFLSDIYVHNIDFYQSILKERGAMSSNLLAREGDAYNAPAPYFGNTHIWSDFSDWLKIIPSVNYGIYSDEAGMALIEQLPQILKGKPIDQALSDIEEQVKTQIQ